MARREREFESSERMTEHEALMWNVEKDPWLNASGASLTLLDQPIAVDDLKRLLRAGMARMPRLYERVVPGLGRLSTPAWIPDAEFDLDYHIREIELPAPGDQRTLFDMAAQLYSEPLDRTRPLWRFVVVRGLEGGRGAIYAMMHHVISDGIGQLRMAEMYQQLTRDEELPPDVDLEAIIAEAVASSNAKEAGGDGGSSLIETARHTATHLARRQLGIARRVAGEVALWGADPGRARSKVAAIGETAGSTVKQVASTRGEDSGGSPLWKNRSRHRHLEYVSVPVDSLKVAGRSVGGTINDAFLAGLAEAAHRYHADRDAQVETFNSSFVMSTRTDAKAGGNSFTPVMVELPGATMSITQRLEEVRDATTDAVEQTKRTGGIGGLSGIVNLLPTSVVTRTARSQGARIDFATSNLRGAPVDLYCAGAKVTATVPIGPVAGTGANITALSYAGRFDIGIFLDPHAIEEPQAFKDCIEAAFADMFAEVGAPTPATAKTTKKPAKKKPAARAAKATTKPAAKKAAAKPAAAKKAAAKPAATKKAAAKPAAAKKAAAKPAAAKKAAAKPAATKKAAAKPAATKKAAAKPAAAKKAAAKPAATKKAAAKPAAAKKAAAKPAAAKKTATKPAAAKKAAAAKAPTKKAAATKKTRASTSA